MPAGAAIRALPVRHMAALIRCQIEPMHKTGNIVTRVLTIIALTLGVSFGVSAVAQESVVVPLNIQEEAPDADTEVQPLDVPQDMTPVPDADGISRIAVVRTLDKITARVRDVDAPVGVPVMFGSFEILVQTCNRHPPEEAPETSAFIQITEHRLDGSLVQIFSGWMFASTPSLNPVEHPVYDVWLIDCRTL